MEASQNGKKIKTELLDDLTLRFLINNEEFAQLNPEDYFFTLELAYWHALDFFKIESMPLLEFTKQIFAHNGISRNTLADYTKFKKYKQTIKVFGTIMFSPGLTHVLVVKQSNNNNITFPKGKAMKNESEMECAARETFEEVGYDASDKIVDISVTVFDKLTFYCAFNVNMEYPFQTNTRNEISKIFWFDLRKLNDVKDKKEYKIFYVAYKAIQSKIRDISRSWFRFDLKKLQDRMDEALEESFPD